MGLHACISALPGDQDHIAVIPVIYAPSPCPSHLQRPGLENTYASPGGRVTTSLIAMEPVRNIYANQSPQARPLMCHNSSSLPILKAGSVSALLAEKQRLAASSSAAVAGDVIRLLRQRCGPSHRTSTEDRSERSESMRGAR